MHGPDQHLRRKTKSSGKRLRRVRATLLVLRRRFSETWSSRPFLPVIAKQTAGREAEFPPEASDKPDTPPPLAQTTASRVDHPKTSLRRHGSNTAVSVIAA